MSNFNTRTASYSNSYTAHRCEFEDWIAGQGTAAAGLLDALREGKTADALVAECEADRWFCDGEDNEQPHDWYDANVLRAVVADLLSEARKDAAFDGSCYLIAVPHQSPAALWRPNTYERSEVEDLHCSIPLRTQEDLDYARNYTGHQASRVQALAEEAANYL